MGRGRIGMTHTAFRKRLLARETLVGAFVKTPAPILCEVLGLTALDTVCLDAEHAPFGRLELDQCVQALFAAEMPPLIRVAARRPEYIQQALDYGAAGVLVPHVSGPDEALAVVHAARFGAGRGYAGSTRAAGYTTRPMRACLADSAAGSSLIVQIEDARAVAAIDEICAVRGVDCVFAGRMDLTVALKADSPNDRRVIQAIEKICRAGADSGTTVGMFIPAPEESQQWIEQGASLFILGSDHTFILQGAKNLLSFFKP